MQIADVKDKIAITLEGSWGFVEGRGVGWRTTIPQDCTQDELDTLLDKLRLAIERQDFWYKLGSAEILVYEEEVRIAKTLAGIKAIETKYKGELELISRDDADQRRQLIAILVKQNSELEVHQKAAENIRAKLNGHAGP